MPAQAAKQERKYDVCVFGATGFTGTLCAKYLSQHPQKPRWAIAGRSESRLSGLKTKLSLPSSVGVIVAQNQDYKSLVDMTSQCKVLINIVGPFRPFKAHQVVKACLETGCHYVDLSGETAFNSDLIQQFHSEAEAKNLVIAPSVGFDSLPFDLTTFLAVQKVKELTGGKQDAVLAECAYDLPPAFSAGTLSSAISMADEKDQMLPVKGDWLSPIPKPDSLRFEPVRFFPQRGRWGAQTAFTYHNTRIVNRTAGLLQHAIPNHSPYGKDFEYKEGFILPNKFVATMVAYIGYTSLWFLMNFALVRWIMKKTIKANTGPSEKVQNSAILKVATLATSKDGKTKVLCSMKAKGDGGYLLTSRMIVETALTILEPNKEQLGPFAARGGVLTPALVGADKIAERLVKYAQFDITTEKFDPTTAVESRKKK